MRILVAFPLSSIGGSQLATLETITALKSLGYTVDALIPSNGPLENLLIESCDNVIISKYMWWMSPTITSIRKRLKDILVTMLRAFRFSKKIKAKYDITITSTVTFPFLAIASKLANIKHCWYIHEFGKEDHQLKYHINENLYISLMNRLSAMVVVNSQVVYNKFIKHIPREKIHIVRNSVTIKESTTESFTKQSNSSRFKLLIVGRKAKGKRQEDAIKALELLKAKGIDAELDLIGSEDKDYKDYLIKTAQSAQIEDRINFIAFTNDTPKFYKHADLVLVTSRSEAFGRVAIEAMKHSKCVIMPDTGSGPEIIQEKFNGMLFKAEDPSELANKIQILYYDRELKKEIEKNAKTWSENHFNPQKHQKEFENIIRSMI